VSLISLVALVHVLAALLYVAGYVGTNLLTEAARRSTDDVSLRAAIGFSGLFDRRLMIPFGTLTGLAGLVLTALNGYPWTAPWVVASIVLYGAVIAVGIVIWGRHGRRIATALAAGRLDDVRALLREPRYVALSRIENVVVAIIAALMVVRPG
jgi:uncharacterized membrane protein